jgi:hypothetical protein
VNTYKVNPDLPLRRPELREVLVGELLNALAFQTLEEKASPEKKLALNDGI